MFNAKPEDIKNLNKKRNRSFTQVEKINISLNKEDYFQKKICSAENNKKNNLDIYNNEIRYFMAMIDIKCQNESFDNINKIKGDDLNLECRKRKALEIINTLSLKGNKNDEIIENSLSYNNTDKFIIYKAIKYYHEIGDNNKLKKIINKYKYCITKKIKIIENEKQKIIDLNNIYKIKLPIYEIEELPNCQINRTNIIDLRNSLIELFTNYYHISNSYIKISKIMKKNDLNEIFKIKYEPLSNTNLCQLNFENEKKNIILNKYKGIDEIDEIVGKDKDAHILVLIENFMSQYLFIKDLEFFNNNQDISYENNLTLYYNYLVYSLYVQVIEVNEKEAFISFKKDKLFIYSSLSSFHDYIFDECLDNNMPIDKEIDKLLRLLLLALSSNGLKAFHFLIKYIHLAKKEGTKFLESESAQKLTDLINKDMKPKKAFISEDKIILEEYLGNTLIINYNIYSESLIQRISIEQSLDSLWYSTKFENFQNQNFFLPEDINYLKYIIKHILSSKLFKQIFNNFNNISELADYYFDNINNIDDYINRIIFLPFKTPQFDKYALTDRRSLLVLVSGFPEKSISSILYYKFYRIIELGLRTLVLSMHEPPHFLKSVYNIISNGKISRRTSSNEEIEGGFLLEEVLFGWVSNSNNPLDLDKFSLEKKIKNNNKMLANKKIDLVTALKLLDPAIYNKDLSFFRKSIFEINKEKLKTFTFSNLDENYRSYLKSIFENEESIKTNWKKELSINASMSSDSSLSVGYISTNHNIK